MERLLGKLKRDGVKESAFARLIGESDQSFHNWKKRGSIPTPKVAKVAKAAKVSADWLLSGEENPENDKEVVHVSTDSLQRLAKLVELWAHLTDEFQTYLLERAGQAVDATRHGRQPPDLNLRTNRAVRQKVTGRR
jgi:phage repressor protein C with HTH and peptisase S24 domain